MKVTLIAAMSADGYIAQAKDQPSLEWTSKEDLRFFVQTTKRLGTMVMGRTTWETIGKPLKGRKIIVLSGRDIALPAWDGGALCEVQAADMAVGDLVDKLSSAGVETLAVCGGASVYGQFLQAGLVDELLLTVEPHVFGSGVPLAEGVDACRLNLADVERLGDQAVVLRFTTKETVPK